MSDTGSRSLMGLAAAAAARLHRPMLFAVPLLVAWQIYGRIAAPDVPTPGWVGGSMATLLTGIALSGLLRAVMRERDDALARLKQSSDVADAEAALDGEAVRVELDVRLTAPSRPGYGLIGIQLSDDAAAPGRLVACERTAALLLCRHPDVVIAARPAPGRHVALVAADNVAQVRAIARDWYTTLNEAPAGTPASEAPSRACIGGLLIEPQAAIDADDALGALWNAAAIAGSVREPRLFVEPLSQTMIDARRAHRQKIEHVRQAIREARIELHAQLLAVVGEPAGRLEYEIFTRLRDSEGDLVAPAEFLPLAAQAHLTGELDRAVIRCAFGWLQAHPAALARTARCAINLSEATVADASLAAYAREQRLAHGIPAGKVVFELAEGHVIRHPEAAARLIEELKADGFGIALDDFGTGLATFEYMKRFPLDSLKIDGALIRNLASSPIDEEIVGAMVRAARRLGVRTVAEHVHSERVLDRLVELGVDQVQGELIGAPRPLHQLFDPGQFAGAPTENRSKDYSL